MPTLTTRRTRHHHGGITVRVRRDAKPFAIIIWDPTFDPPWMVFPWGADRESDPITWGEFKTEASAMACVRRHAKRPGAQ